MGQPSDPTNPIQSFRELFDWKILPVAALTAAILYSAVAIVGGYERFETVLAGADSSWVWVPFALMVGNVFLASLRFGLLLGAFEEAPPYRETLRVVLAAWPLGLLMPARSNDLVRAVLFGGEISGWKCTGAVLMERWIDLQTVLLYSAIGLLVVGWSGLAASLVVLVVSGWGVLFRLPSVVEDLSQISFLARFEEQLSSIFEVFGRLRRQRCRLLLAITTSLIVWAAVISIVYALCVIFGADLSVGTIAAFWPLASIVGMLPVTVGGMGTRDAAFLGVLALVGSPVPESQVLAVTMGYSVVTVIFPAAIGLPFTVAGFLRL